MRGNANDDMTDHKGGSDSFFDEGISGSRYEWRRNSYKRIAIQAVIKFIWRMGGMYSLRQKNYGVNPRKIYKNLK